MKEPVYIEGTVEEVSDEGAVTKLSDGRLAISRYPAALLESPYGLIKLVLSVPSISR